MNKNTPRPKGTALIVIGLLGVAVLVSLKPENSTDLIWMSCFAGLSLIGAALNIRHQKLKRK